MDLNKLREAEEILSENQLKIGAEIESAFESRKEELKERIYKEITSLYDTTLPRYFWQDRFQRRCNSYRPKDGWMIGSDISLHDLLSFGYIGNENEFQLKFQNFEEASSPAVRRIAEEVVKDVTGRYIGDLGDGSEATLIGMKIASLFIKNGTASKFYYTEDALKFLGVDTKSTSLKDIL